MHDFKFVLFKQQCCGPVSCHIALILTSFLVVCNVCDVGNGLQYLYMQPNGLN